MSKRVIVVAAHPDDEVLGCGGTAARHALSGDEVHVLIVAEGATSRAERRDDEQFGDMLDKLRNAANLAAERLGTRAPQLLGLPDNRLDTLPLLNVVKQVEAVFERVKPQVVYTHHAYDLNVDHGVVHRAVLTAARPLPGTTIEAIYAFETLSSTEWASPGAATTFIPTRFVDIGQTFERKLSALKVYDAEMRPFPHARSLEAVEALARYRGASCGMQCAEAFVVVRECVS